MNLIEAYKSGQFIRRKNRTTWPMNKGGFWREKGYHRCDPSLGHWFDKTTYLHEIHPDADDLLATDWEVKEKL